MAVDVVTAAWLSATVAVAATLATAAPATAAAYVLARWRFAGKWALSAACLSPLVLPPVVTGLLLLRLFGRSGPLGPALDALGVPVVFSWTGAVVAAAVSGFPLFVTAARSAFDAVDPRFEEVSRTLGRPPAATFRAVTLPLAFPGLAAAAVLSFARALGEFGATAVLAGNVEGRTRTLSLAVYSLLDAPDGERRAMPLAAISVALALGSLVIVEALLRRQRARMDLDG